MTIKEQNYIIDKLFYILINKGIDVSFNRLELSEIRQLPSYSNIFLNIKLKKINIKIMVTYDINDIFYIILETGQIKKLKNITKLELLELIFFELDN